STYLLTSFVYYLALGLSGNQDHPLGRVDDHATIDLTGSVSVTPKTKAALDQIRQHESDEAMAKRLQEEMDREYAIALQDTTSSHEPVPNETFDPMFALSPPSELQTGGHEWHMYSPVRPRSRNSRQRGEKCNMSHLPCGSESDLVMKDTEPFVY
ncbi:hypothetical protein MAR_009310, partial [Mya arenaria]